MILSGNPVGREGTCSTCNWARRAGAEALVACVWPGGPRAEGDTTGRAPALQMAAQEDKITNLGRQDGHMLVPCGARCSAHAPRRLTTRPPAHTRRERAEQHVREMASALHLDLAAVIRVTTGQDARVEDLSSADLQTLEEHFRAAVQARDAAAVLAQQALTPAQQNAQWRELLGL